MRTLIVSALIVFTASPLFAQEFRRNAWGLVAAPMTYELTGNDLGTNTSLDLGLFYSRFISHAISARVEVFAQDRKYMTEEFSPDGLGGGEWIPYIVDEAALAATLLLNFDRREDLAGHQLRLSIGAGGMATKVLDQTIRHADPGFATSVGWGDYSKLGWLMEAGMALDVEPGSGVFARLRIQRDVSIFGESDDADIVRELAAFGFHVGAEFGF